MKNTEMILDWSKPIQFRNGEPCELVTEKSSNFPGKPVAILRPNEPNAMCAIWFYPESGKGNKTEMDIINA